MDHEKNKALVKRYIEMWNTGNVALADEVLAPTWKDHAHPEVTDADSVKQAVQQIRSAFPDFHITIEHILSKDNLVVLRSTVHRGGTSRVMWFIRIDAGKMVEMWTAKIAR